ncbi:MAG TPA: 30S ribosome-binding factor RbfA [Pyrinomonadaceae bacterium]|jgi:ribosome-binding factor A
MRRADKVADLLREEITQIVGYELEDPRLEAVTVTDVRVSDNLRDARVFVTVSGSEDEAKAALAALRHAAQYVRKQLILALDLAHAPELHFVRDKVEERGARVDQLLSEIGRELEHRDSEERMNDGGRMQNDDKA